MLEVDKYSPRDRRIDVGLIAASAAVVGLVIYAASDSDEEDQAETFGEVWELMDPNALTVAMQRGLVYPSEVQHVIDSGRVENVSAAVLLLQGAPGAFNDSERDTLAACMRPTYPELLLFAATFTVEEGLSPGAFILDYMDPEDDTPTMAAIVRHVKKLRKAAADAHR